MSLAANPITKPADLKGKTIGVGASDDAEWSAFLKVNNIAKSDVNTVPASFDPSPLAAGKWDGYLAFLNNEVAAVRRRRASRRPCSGSPTSACRATTTSTR